MPARDGIPARARVTGELEPGVYRVELANGHTAVGRLKKGAAGACAPGAEVIILFHPYDLSRGWIVPVAG